MKQKEFKFQYKQHYKQQALQDKYKKCRERMTQSAICGEKNKVGCDGCPFDMPLDEWLCHLDIDGQK